MTEWEIRKSIGSDVPVSWHLERHPDLFEVTGWRNDGMKAARLWALVPQEGDGVRPANHEIDEVVDMIRSMIDRDRAQVAGMLASYDARLAKRLAALLLEEAGK